MIASLQCLVANSFVRSNPSLSRTALNDVSTSPGWENLLKINGSNSGNLDEANNTGAVANPSFKSAAAGFPSWLDDALKSTQRKKYWSTE